MPHTRSRADTAALLPPLQVTERSLRQLARSTRSQSGGAESSTGGQPDAPLQGSLASELSTPSAISPRLSLPFAPGFDPFQHSNPLFSSLVGTAVDLMDPLLAHLSVSKPAFVWDGVTRGLVYEQSKAQLKQLDIRSRTVALQRDESAQYNVSSRLNNISAQLPELSRGFAVIEKFKETFSHYFSQAKHNRYPPADDAAEQLMIVVGAYVPAATQAAEAQSSLLLRGGLQYDPIARAAGQLNLLAPTEAEYEAAVLADQLAAADSAVLADEPDVTQSSGEDGAAFSSRQQAQQQRRNQAAAAAAAAAATLQRFNTRSQVTSFPTVKGNDVSPSDAIMVLFWIAMDVIFGMGDAERQEGFYKMGTAGTQGSDSLDVFGYKVTKEFMEVRHMGGPAASRPDKTFIMGLNDNKLREQLGLWAQQHLTGVADGSIRLRAVIDQALKLQQDQLSEAQWNLQYAAHTGQTLKGSQLSSQSSDSKAHDTPSKHLTCSAQGTVLKVQDVSVPYASRITANGEPRWSQQQQDSVLKSTRRADFQLELAKGLAKATRQPEHPDAICSRCHITARHTNRNCKERSHPGAAAAAQVAAAALQPGRSNSSDSQLERLQATVQQLAAQVAEQQHRGQPFTAAAGQQQQQQQQQPGQFHGAVKPFNKYGNRGQDTPLDPCPVCDFSRGHKMCFYAHPNKAPQEWKPYRAAPVKAIITYLTRCQELAVPPNLSQVTPQVQEAAKQGKLPPAVQRMPAVLQAVNARAAAAAFLPEQQFPNYWPGVNPFDYLPSSSSSFGGSSSAAASVPQQYGMPHAAAGQFASQPSTPGNPWAAAGSSAAAAAGNPAAAAAANLDRPFSSANSSSSFPGAPPAFGMLAVAPLSFNVLQQQAGSCSSSIGRDHDALAVTRQRAGNPMGFLPLDRVPDEPNTAAGGRAVPEPAANVNNSVQHRLLSAVVSNLSTACSLLNPAAAQSVLLLQKQLQKAMQSGTQEEQAKLTSEFFYQFSALATDFHKPALSLVMSSSAAGAAAASDAPVAAAASEPTSGSAAAAAAAADSPQVQQLNSMLKPPKLTFLPSFVDYKQHMEGSEVLNKLSAADPDMGLYVQIGTGQLHGISAAVNDDGSNILLISEKQCSRMGATIYRDSSPLLKGLDGEMRNYIIGRTGPAKLILGRGTPYPLTVDVPCMWVVAGDAGGMYDVLISKDTFKAWFAHVNPAYRHLVWYPLAAQNDFSVLAGVPVRGSVTKQSALAAIQQQAVVGAAVAGAAAARGVYSHGVACACTAGAALPSNLF